MTILFRNARVIDGSGAPPCRADVRIEGERIAAVMRRDDGDVRSSAAHGDARSDAASGRTHATSERLPTASGRPDAGDMVVECEGRTLMPGLVEPHAHLSFLDQAHPRAFQDLPVEEHLLATLEHAKLYLDQGFTSAFSAAATKPRLDVVVRNAIDAGRFPGPRLRAASVQLTVTGGVGDLRQLHLDPGDAMYTRACDGPVEFRRAAREACREGVDVLKIVPSGDTSTPQVPSAQTLMSDDEVAAVMEVARERGRRVAAHARSAASVKMCVRHGVDVIYHATWADAEARDMLEAARARLFVAPALSVTWTRLHESGRHGLPSSPAVRERIGRDLDATVACMRDLKRRGVRVLPGGDYGFQWNPHGRNARDLAFFTDLLGFTPMEAIVAATRDAGALMGLPHGVGEVRAGFLADLLLVDGDPLGDVTLLQDAARLAAIMKGGAFHKPPPAHLARPAAAAGSGAD
jgi:imidazolonepropionase-like amidohydrolase